MSEETDDDKDPYFSTHGGELYKAINKLSEEVSPHETVPLAAFLKLEAGMVALRDAFNPLLEAVLSLDLDPEQRAKVLKISKPLMLFTRSTGSSLKASFRPDEKE